MNYSKQQTKLEMPAFFIFIPCLFMPSRSGEHLFDDPGTVQRRETKEGIHCQIKSYKRPFRSDSCSNSIYGKDSWFPKLH